MHDMTLLELVRQRAERIDRAAERARLVRYVMPRRRHGVDIEGR